MSKTRTGFFSRRDFVRAGALVAAAVAGSDDVSALALERPLSDEASSVRLGLASYTFRNFSRTQLIAFMKQLNVFALNAKDRHLRSMSGGIRRTRGLFRSAPLHAAGAIYFTKMKMQTSGRV
jgi:hypothetical protein